MSEVTVRQLASTVGVPLDKLMSQLSEAGLAVSGADDVLSNDEKLKLLGYLRGSKTPADDLPETAKKVTLTRKSVSELKQSRVAPGGRATKSVSVEVRKRRTYVKKSEVTTGDDELQKVELAQKELEQERSQAAAEETLRGEKEAQIVQQREAEEEKKRLQSEQLIRQQEAEKLEQERLEQERIDQERKAKEVAEQAAVSKKQTSETPAKKASASDAQAKPAARKKPAAKPSRSDAGGANRGDSRKQLHVRDTGKKRKHKGKGSKHSRRAVVRETEHGFEKPSQPVIHDVVIPETIVVSELAKRMSVKAAEVIKTLMGMGMMATINQVLDREDAALIVDEMGHNAILRDEDSLEQDVMASITDEDLAVQTRAPVVTIMGHVDHGKTSLLDYIRKTRVTAGEAGGITQHIGAYRVNTEQGSLAFLDTPGHAAFTAMRARGAQVTDIVVVVVAADDGVMPQTKEAIEHARAAKVPMIIAVNKMDKEGADADRVKNELSVMEVIPEDWGGDTQFVPVSALTGAGVGDLLEALVLQSEILELTAPVTGRAAGFVIESRLDKGRGPVATVLVQKGILNKGDIVLAGTEFGRVRAMVDEDGKAQASAGPSTPVEVIGLSGVPDAGVEFQVMPNERQARDVAENRSEKERSSKMAEQQKAKLDNLFTHMETGEILDLNLMVKTDVHGSLEALRESLIKLSTDEVRVNVIYGGIGGITESDANLAVASNAIIIGFNVRADAAARKVIDTKQIDLHYYSVIYDVIDEVKRSINGLLGPDIKEQIVGVAEVRDVFKSPKLGAIAGCMVMEGKVVRNLPIRVLRDNVVIYEGQLESLRRFKDDATEVKAGVECGIGVKNYNDVKPGDQIEAYERVEVARTIV